ncbi:oligosaccharide flippase family protein [Propionivibrio sp.]|uniref:oligosaccharide flippase family protein n=1 Tax=Propionivibrio sp. TaxID=2212460 RepID=UPI0025FE5115|nr:oligosaccharide flippase family protein [Propionivibrio sp.]
MSFGGKLTLNSLMNTLAIGAPELFLGKIQTMTAAGQFSRSLGLVSMFQRLIMDAVNAVALPYFAKQFRESKDYAASFIVAMELVTGLGWSFFAGICVLAYPAIHILYGDQWGDAVNPTLMARHCLRNRCSFFGMLHTFDSHWRSNGFTENHGCVDFAVLGGYFCRCYPGPCNLESTIGDCCIHCCYSLASIGIKTHRLSR